MPAAGPERVRAPPRPGGSVDPWTRAERGTPPPASADPSPLPRAPGRSAGGSGSFRSFREVFQGPDSRSRRQYQRRRRQPRDRARDGVRPDRGRHVRYRDGAGRAMEYLFGPRPQLLLPGRWGGQRAAGTAQPAPRPPACSCPAAPAGGVAGGSGPNVEPQNPSAGRRLADVPPCRSTPSARGRRTRWPSTATRRSPPALRQPRPRPRQDPSAASNAAAGSARPARCGAPPTPR